MIEVAQNQQKFLPGKYRIRSKNLKAKEKQEQAYIDALKKFRKKVESDLPASEPILTRGGDVTGIKTAFYTKFDFLDFIDEILEEKERKGD